MMPEICKLLPVYLCPPSSLKRHLFILGWGWGLRLEDRELLSSFSIVKLFLFKISSICLICINNKQLQGVSQSTNKEANKQLQGRLSALHNYLGRACFACSHLFHENLSLSSPNFFHCSSFLSQPPSFCPVLLFPTYQR